MTGVSSLNDDSYPGEFETTIGCIGFSRYLRHVNDPHFPEGKYRRTYMQMQLERPDKLVSIQALGYSTIVVGAYNDSLECRLFSMNGDLETSFPVHTSSRPLQPGTPDWANYIKGVIANFPCKFFF